MIICDITELNNYGYNILYYTHHIIFISNNYIIFILFNN